MDRDELLKALWYGFPRPGFMHSGELERAPTRIKLVGGISITIPPSEEEVSAIKEGSIFSSAGTGCWKAACGLEDNFPSDAVAADGLAKMLGLQLSSDMIGLQAEILSVVFYEGNQVNKSFKTHKANYFATMVIHLPLREGAVLTMHYSDRKVQACNSRAVHTFFGECKLATQDDSAAGLCLVFGLRSPQVCEASPSFLHALVKTKALIHPWLEQTDPVVLAFSLPECLEEDRDNLVIVELLKNCGLELHFATIKTGEWFTDTCGYETCEDERWQKYDPPIAVEWTTLDGTKCFDGNRLVLNEGMLVEQSGISEDHHGAPVLVAWRPQKKVQAISLIDFPLSLKLLKEGSQDVEALSFLIRNSGRRASYSAKVLNLCLDWEQKDLALHLIKDVEAITEAFAEPLARAVLAYGWEECDGERLILGTDWNDGALASLAICLESCGCHPEALKVVDKLWTVVTTEVAGTKYMALNARIILLPRMLLQEESLVQESLHEIAKDPHAALQIMRKSAGLIQLGDDHRMLDFFKQLVRNVEDPGEAIQSSLWLGDASLVEEFMKDLTGEEDYVGELLQDHDFTSNLSTLIKRKSLRRLLEMRLAFLGSNEPEYAYVPHFKKMKVEERISYAEDYSKFKIHHMTWLKEVPKLKELLQVLDFFDEHSHSAFTLR